MSEDRRRLIEVAFPLKQASLDSVHEKNVRHGHISTLHIWPARRPLAACRAALIATLLSDPGNKEERDKILEKLGGKVVEVVKKKKLPSGKVEYVKIEETVGGVLHWGRESSPDLQWFRQKIREAYGGRAPRVLDPFAGGGAIPLEAMRLGCDVTAIDINPVAWFILKCTLEYPRQLAGQHRPLPDFAVNSPEFMEQFFKGGAKLTKKQLERNLWAVQERLFPPPDVDLAWHVRAWGWWVLQKAKAELEKFYPVVDGKPTVAYLWARTVKCKNCRAMIPLLKTKWLCKKDNKRVLLIVTPNENRAGVVFGIQNDVPQVGGNAAQRREHDKRIGKGTMSRSGVTCPICGTTNATEDIRVEAGIGRLGAVLTAVAVDGPHGKEYRLPTAEETERPSEAGHWVPPLFQTTPFGVPSEPVPQGGSRRTGGSPFTVHIYGLDSWGKLFTPRQLLAVGTLVKFLRDATLRMRASGYDEAWVAGLTAALALVVDRLADYSSTLCMWHNSKEQVSHTFTRFALPIVWDYCEVNCFSETTGGYAGAVDWVSRVQSSLQEALSRAAAPTVKANSAVALEEPVLFDVVLTDPPYYDAIPYSDAMDFFYVWLRRMLAGISKDFDAVFAGDTSPKWNHSQGDGELIDDPSRFGGDRIRSKLAYEEGMYRAFQAANSVLTSEGRFVVVFANKQPDAWEALVSSIIRAGFIVDGSWPIQTEMNTRVRAQASAALASSVWLVCKKRPGVFRPGFDETVLTQMRERIESRLRKFWDDGIRGPDFVWAATGPALEVYSQHPVVLKANVQGERLSVSEFLGHVRRIVVDFIVGQVLSHNGSPEAVSGLDDVTTYYILHRYDFGFEEAPIGACILYAISCGLSDRDLTDRYDLLVRKGDSAPPEEEQGEAGEESEEEEAGSSGSGSKAKLKPWKQRKGKSLGLEADGRPAPLIDQIHRLMHLWKAGDVVKVDDYLDARALRRNRIFAQVLQALIELAEAGSEERSILESISNHVRARGETYEDRQEKMDSAATIRVD